MQKILLKTYKWRYYQYVKAQHGIAVFISQENEACGEREGDRHEGERQLLLESWGQLSRVWSTQAGVCRNPVWIWPPFSLYTRAYSKHKLRNVHTQQSSLLRRVRSYTPGANLINSHINSAQYLSTKICWLDYLDRKHCDQCSKLFFILF